MYFIKDINAIVRLIHLCSMNLFINTFSSDFRFIYLEIEMTNKFALVGIGRTRTHFDGESPGMGIRNFRFFQLDMEMEKGM